MPRSIDCDYCGDDIEPGTGTMFVRLNGQTVHFCSSKCEKNADLGREARDLEWTEAGRTTRGRMAEAAEAADVAAGAETRDTDLEDQGQDVDAVDDGDADLEEDDVESDADETDDEPTSDTSEDSAEESDEDADEETEEAQA